MKKKIIFGLLFLSILVCVLFSRIGICWRPFNKDYFNWFPYANGDTVVFTSNDSVKKYIVSDFKALHNKTYSKYAKCGCCEDGIQLSLKSATDTIDIDFMNFQNDKSCLGEYLSVGKYTESDGLRIKKVGSKEYISIQNDTFLIAKNIGISSFVFQNKRFSFDKIIKSKNRKISQSKFCD